MQPSFILGSMALLALACGSGTPTHSRQLAPMPTRDGRPALRNPTPLSPRLANYRIEAKIDVDAHRITANETLLWTNAGIASVDTIPLHLYMNAFKNESSVFMKESRGRHRRAKMAEDKWGWIEVSSIRDALTGTELRPRATFGVDETTLSVPLAAPVAPGETVALDIFFVTQLPEVFARTGYKGAFMMIGQWFPKIGVLDVLGERQAWHCEPFHLNSEFYADFGVYDVTIDIHESHVVAATGVLESAESIGDGMRRLIYRAEDVHDFAIMADPFMKMAKTTADGDVEVRVYYRPEQEAFVGRHLEAGKQTIEIFGNYFFKYPWPIMSIIDPPRDAAAGAGGMEYPTIVTTAADIYYTPPGFYLPTPPGVYLPEFVTVHEVGHNWFQGILASNEVDEAWLDEGVNQYANGIVMDEWKGADRSVVDWAGIQIGYSDVLGLRTNASELISPIATRSYEFANNRDYGTNTYRKTAVALKTLENMVGKERFVAALGVYAKRFAFKHPTREDFFNTLNEQLGSAMVGDVKWYLEPAFLGTGGPDFRVVSIDTRKLHPPRGVFGEGDQRKTVGKAPAEATWLSDVLVVNLGNVPSEVNISFGFDDGGFVHRRWKGRTRWRHFEFRREAAVTEVLIDPPRKVPFETNRIDNNLRKPGSSKASLRAAARASFWQQTLLQVMGL